MEPISPPVPEARPLTVPEKERPDRRLSDVCPISPPTFSVPSTLPDTAQFRTSERMASPARMPTLGPADTEASSMVSPTTVAPSNTPKSPAMPAAGALTSSPRTTWPFPSKTPLNGRLPPSR